MRKSIKPPQKYAYVDLVVYAQKALKMRNLTLIMKSSLVESLHSGLLL